MDKITKEWLQQKIAAMEATRDEIPFGLDEDDSNTLAAMKMALASLEEEPRGYIDAGTPDDGISILTKKKLLKTDIALYTAPPASVSVPDVMAGKSFEYIANTFQVSISEAQWILVGWNACRAAMLQSFGNSEQLNSQVIPDGWVLVPVEPTDEMVIEGFESEPDELFSKSEEWEAYQEMSGCEQAAHRAKLCWVAMITAAPKLKGC